MRVSIRASITVRIRVIGTFACKPPVNCAHGPHLDTQGELLHPQADMGRGYLPLASEGERWERVSGARSRRQ